jgi:rhodanese-related sulfurtransferase
MKKLTLTILMLLVATTIASGQQGSAQNAKAPKSQAKVLSRAEFDDFFAKSDQILIIDVRRPDEIKDIGGFPVYLNVQISDLEKSLSWIPKDRTIITVSNHAGRGGRAADILTKNGFNVAGTIGVQTYEQAGGTFAKIIAVPPPAPATTAEKKEP